jgi:hypothetical protein
MPRGNFLYCVDAFTGDEIWRFPGACQSEASLGAGISNGMYWFNDRYTGCTIMFGKGESAVTVSALPSVIANGDSVLIEGTILDQSAGAKDTPCIADEDMTDWMEYLYLGWPMPTDASGVPVRLAAIRSDGSFFDIATVTSDVMGHFEYLWTPIEEDTYKVLAMFEGTESYWPSSAQVGLGVGPEPTPYPEAPTEGEVAEEVVNQLPDYSTTDLAIIAAIVVVAILVVYTLWTVRKQRK